MKLKMLLYCTKAGLILRDYRGKAIFDRFVLSPTDRPFTTDDRQPVLNGKIVAECDFEVEEIKSIETPEYAGSECNTFLYDVSLDFATKTMAKDSLLKHSRLNEEELYKYKPKYAIHIKNLHVFDKPKELSDYYKTFERIFYRHLIETHSSSSAIYIPESKIYFMDYCDELKKAPQNMCYAFDKDGNKYVVISVRPEWLCLILNGLKDVELRRKVLKEMKE